MENKYEKILETIREYYPKWFNEDEDDEAKACFEEDLDTLQELIDRYDTQKNNIKELNKIVSRLEKALDKACDIIANTNNHFTPKEIQEEKMGWKEYLLKEIEVKKC